ncbi:MAG: heavy metal translocating P-type ATPase [Acidimicrobiales bacterium]
MAPRDRQGIARAWARSTTGFGAVAAAAAGFVAGLTLDAIGAPVPAAIAYGAGIVIGGWGPGRDGIRALGERRLDVDLLMVVAAIAAALLGQWRDGSLLILIFATTGALEDAATERTAAGVRALLVDSPESAERIVAGAQPVVVPVDQLTVGDRVLVRPGGRVPTDGTVVDGEAAVDESSLTGESMPRRKVPGRPVMAGSTVSEGALAVEVTTIAADSTLARLSAAVDEAVEQQPPTQLFIERFEQRYSIGVVVAALLLVAIGPWWWGWTVDETVLRTMTFLVVASPCAVVLATMPATLSALAAAARHRVLLRGGTVLEQLAVVDLAAFDKTGTLTVGTPRVVAVTVVDDEPSGLDEDRLLAVAAAAERWSEHPIGRAIVTAAGERHLTVPTADEVELVPSRGVVATVDRARVRVGGHALLGDFEARADGSVVGVEIGGRIAGYIELSDQVRAEAACTIACLADGGVHETWMLTGDHALAAASVAAQAGVARHGHDLLPDDKVAAIRRLDPSGRRLVYVGDGVNDAAALATAGVGVSLGQGGAALALDAADLIIMDDDLHRLPDVIALAKRTRRIVRTNLAFALVVIVTLVTVDLAGRLPLVLGVIGHEGSSAIVALNGLRLLRWRPPSHPRRPINLLPADPGPAVARSGSTS